MNTEENQLCFSTQERRLVASKDGEPLTNIERARLLNDIADLKAIIEEQKQHIAGEAERQAKAVEAEVKAVVERYEQEVARIHNINPRVIEVAERIVAGWEREAAAASIRLREKLSRMSIAVDPTIILDLVEIGVGKLASRFRPKHRGLTLKTGRSRILP